MILQHLLTLARIKLQMIGDDHYRQRTFRSKFRALERKIDRLVAKTSEEEISDEARKRATADATKGLHALELILNEGLRPVIGHFQAEAEKYVCTLLNISIIEVNSIADLLAEIGKDVASENALGELLYSQKNILKAPADLGDYDPSIYNLRTTLTNIIKSCRDLPENKKQLII